MSMLQVRNISPETHRVLKSRAALAGQTLSEYVARELDFIASRPTPEEFFRPTPGRLANADAEREAAADIVRRERDSR
ncbi:MAG: hypothetical protein LBC97_08425 [Bifidobacteriaceae bacterium]|nr:hypothetical protein [Bifidobacteriaceae bacterium]